MFINCNPVGDNKNALSHKYELNTTEIKFIFSASPDWQIAVTEKLPLPDVKQAVDLYTYTYLTRNWIHRIVHKPSYMAPSFQCSFLSLHLFLYISPFSCTGGISKKSSWIVPYSAVTDCSVSLTLKQTSFLRFSKSQGNFQLTVLKSRAQCTDNGRPEQQNLVPRRARTLFALHWTSTILSVQIEYF